MIVAASCFQVCLQGCALWNAPQVGQRVTARHPVTRQLHDGDILTTGHSLYRVQFDRRELGVELIKNVDVMPIDPTENLPVSMLASAAAKGLQVLACCCTICGLIVVLCSVLRCTEAY